MDGIELKALRKQHQLTQRELAKEIGLAKNGNITLRRVENGSTTRPPSNLLLTALKLFFQNIELKKRLK
jgi:transcriptional regulator with XRE-family HTH domain